MKPLMRACGFGLMRRSKMQRGNPGCHLRNYVDAYSKGKYATAAPIMHMLCAICTRMSPLTRCMDGSAHNHTHLNSGKSPG
jgi:hypothetical protein